MDEELSTAVRNGNTEAFATIYERYKDSIYTYAMYLSYNNVQLAHDITSSAFLAFFEYCKEHSIKKLKSCLYQMTHNIAITLMQKEQRSIALEEYHLDAHEDYEYSFLLQQKMTKDIVRKAITHLKPAYAEVIYLYYFDNCSYMEIAEILGTNKNTVGTLIKRAKSCLEQYFSKLGQDSFTLI